MDVMVQPVPQYIGRVRPIVDKIFDGFTGPTDGRFLKMFADDIKQHNSYALRIFTDVKSPESGDTHQKKLVKHLSFGNVSSCLEQHFPSHGKVSGGKPEKSYKISKPRGFEVGEENARQEQYQTR